MSVQEILIGLASGEADSAWDQFLVNYSPLILHVARRYEHDDEAVMDSDDNPITIIGNRICNADYRGRAF